MNEDCNSPQLATQGGCGCKMPLHDLKVILDAVHRRDFADNAANGYSGLDAGYYSLDAGPTLVSSVDFGTPISHSPNTWGRIAALNALSDLYVSGANPLFALNILGFPSNTNSDLITEVVAGARAEMKAAEVSWIGGHSIVSAEPLFGFAVVGSRSELWSEGAERTVIDVEDVLVLTKPIGVGVVLTAIQVGVASSSAIAAAETSMLSSNRLPMDIALDVGIKRCTDVTGFGLAGHLCALLEDVNGTASVNLNRIPVLDETRDYLSQGIVPASAERTYLELSSVDWGCSAMLDRLLLCDPQTSGGVLFVVERSLWPKLREKFKDSSVPASVIGEIIEPTDCKVVVEL